MIFNEQNSVENYLVKELSGVDLNSKTEKYINGNNKWTYKSSDVIDRKIDEVLALSEVKKSLIKINPNIKQKIELADEVIFNLQRIINSVNQIGLVRSNEEFLKWLRGDKTMPFGENNEHIQISR